MKSILLASASAFAFAGAAAADVSMSGSASAYYNVNGGNATFGSSASLKFAASAELNNGWTATTSFSASSTGLNGTAAWGANGNVALTDGTSTLAFGAFDNDAAYGAVGGKLAHQSVGFAKAGYTGFMGSTVLGGAKVAVSTDGTATDVGVNMSLGGADVSFGYGVATGDFGLGLSTSMGGAEISFQTVNGTAWGLGVDYTMGAVALGFNTGDAGTWDVTADYSADPLSVGVVYQSTGAFDVTLGYAMGAVSTSVTFNSPANTWKASVSYAEGALSATASTNSAGAMALDGSYDLGGGAVVYAGTRTVTDAEVYAGVAYDLGSGASVALSYSDTGAGKASATEYAKEYMAGTTLAVSFDF